VGAKIEFLCKKESDQDYKNGKIVLKHRYSETNQNKV